MRRIKGEHEEWFPRFAGRFKRVLWTVLLVSAAVHVGGLFLFGSWVVFRHFFYNEARFVVPPELAKTIEPRNLKYKVQLQEQQRRSGRPRIAPRLSARRVSEFSLPDVPVEMTTVQERIKNEMKTFGAAGVGAGLGGGTGSGGLGLSASTVKFFGITDRGERIAFLIDISLSMVEDDKGGEAGFEKLKAEIGDMIAGLNPGTFFNLILFGDKVDLFEQQMVLATDENKKKSREFLQPYLQGIAESQERSGNILKNYEPAIEGIKSSEENPGRTRMDLAVTAGFEQAADVIFLISDGRPDIVKQLEGEELEKFQERRAKWIEKNPNYQEEFRAQRDKENADRAKKGLPPKVIELPPGAPRPPIWTDKEILEHIEKVGDVAYKEKKRPLPRVNCVAYDCTTPEEENFMKMLTREFRGKFKRAKALAQAIKE
ncbi:MAG: VWA domain-containing protein [Verrucomicrobiae bacterium]|nr:VWA domain-containing protein [Verrucomicrobiae bacterium]